MLWIARSVTMHEGKFFSFVLTPNMTTKLIRQLVHICPKHFCTFDADASKEESREECKHEVHFGRTLRSNSYLPVGSRDVAGSAFPALEEMEAVSLRNW